MAFPVAILNNLCTLFTKASILMFYLRFSVSRRFDITVYSVLSIVIGYCLTGALSVLYACSPINRFWDFSPGTCIDANPWYGTLVSLNVLTDAILLLLPIWLLKPMRAGLAQKAAIAGILGTGGLYVLGSRSCGGSRMLTVSVSLALASTVYTSLSIISTISTTCTDSGSITCGCKSLPTSSYLYADKAKNDRVECCHNLRLSAVPPGPRSPLHAVADVDSSEQSAAPPRHDRGDGQFERR